MVLSRDSLFTEKISTLLKPNLAPRFPAGNYRNLGISPKNQNYFDIGITKYPWTKTSHVTVTLNYLNKKQSTR